MLFRILERLFVVALLLCSMQVVIGLTNPGLVKGASEVVSTDLHMSSIAIEGSVYAWGFLLFLLRWRRVIRAVQAVWPLAGFVALTSLSTLWSIHPSVTLRRSIILLIATLLAIYLGERYTMEKLARLIAQTLCLMMLAVIALYFVAPVYVIDHSVHVGAWKGLSAYKNAFGEYMAVAVILLLRVRFRHLDWLRYGFLLTAAVLLVLSRSAAALFCCVLFVAAMPLWRWIRLERKQRLVIYATAVLIFCPGMYFLATNSGFLFRMLGRDATLTGRTHLWAAALPAILKHPILGYGYDTFWAGLKGEALDVRIACGWLAALADNGYIDLSLSLGVLGVCIFLYVWARSFRNATGYIRMESGPIGVWPVTYLCFYALHNLSESTLLTRGTFPFLLFTMITTSLAVNRRRAAAVALSDREQPDAQWHPWLTEWNTAGQRP